METHSGPGLMTIGEFARLGGVSIKALRIYARIGLLRPAAIRERSGYRLYSAAQLSRLHRILMLKSAGIPLAQIGAQLSRCNAGTLVKVRARLMSRADEIQQQLAWLDGEIRASNGRGVAAPLVIKQTPQMRVLTKRSGIDSYEQTDLLLSDLRKQLPTAARLVPGAIWHDCGQKTGVIDCEVFWVLNRDMRSGAVKQLPAVTVASVLHEGNESTIGATYETARRWIADNRYEVIGPNREIYLGSRGDDFGGLVEIQFPVGKRW